MPVLSEITKKRRAHIVAILRARPDISANEIFKIYTRSKLTPTARWPDNDLIAMLADGVLTRTPPDLPGKSFKWRVADERSRPLAPAHKDARKDGSRRAGTPASP